MPKLEYFVVAQSLSTDRDTNVVSLFHILEELTVPGVPGQLGGFVAVSSWNMAPDERDRDFQVSLRIHLPEGQEPRVMDNFRVNFTAEKARHRVYLYVNGVPIEKPGELRLELLLGGQHQAEHTLTIHVRDEEG